MQTIVRLEGMVEKMLEKLVEEKYYSNKSEAIRAGILELAHRWDISLENESELVVNRVMKMEAEIKSGKKKIVPFEQVAKEAGVKI